VRPAHHLKTAAEMIRSPAHSPGLGNFRGALPAE
jgi:hypothetical protein